ncbi:hypothetical protein BDA96_01G536800 [Sorghum bicolor]|uniref:Uncharacterized protein n=1 Tax=Sorghum bicolor TaxID=4558 RepID=A0A921S7E7_SORBI|nr:hypothetical protein BDA96_01G536800 [Sorghum bicolor]
MLTAPITAPHSRSHLAGKIDEEIAIATDRSSSSERSDHVQHVRYIRVCLAEIDRDDGVRVTVRGVQVPAAQVRARLRLRALLLPRAGRGALRRHPQGVRRQQRVQASRAPAARRPPGGRRHHLLRGAGQAARPHLRLRRPHLRAPAAGDDPAGAAGVAQGAGGAGAAGRARGRQGLRGQRRRGAARVRLPLVQRQWRRRSCRHGGRARRAAGRRVRQWRARVPDRAAGVVGLHAAVAVSRVRARRRGRRRRPAGERRVRGSGGVLVVRGGGERRLEVIVGVPRLRGPAERGLRLPEPSLVRTENY